METRKTKLALTASALAMALVLVGCGGGGSSGSPSGSTAALPAQTTTPDPEPPTPTPYETAVTDIGKADTDAAAQAAVDAAADEVTGTELIALQAAADARKAALAMMARETAQKMALMTAVGMVDTSDLSTQEAVDAAREAITGLRGALDAAADVSDADKAMYQTQLDNAVAAVDGAQDGLDTAERRDNQMTALSDASGALSTALTAIAGKTPTEAELNAAKDAKSALDTAISDAADLTDAEKAPYELQATNAVGPIAAAETAYADAEAASKAAAERAAQLIRNAASMQVAKAINAHTVAGDPPTEFIGDSAASPATMLGITRLAGAARITPVQSSADKKNKPFTTGAAQDAGTGWSGMTFTRSGTAAKKAFTEMGTVYTDIEQAKAQLWTTAFASGTAPTGLTLNTGGEIAIGATASLDAMHFTGILPSAPASGESTTVTIDANAHMIGSFYGVAGDFECGGTACVVTRDSKGKVSVDNNLTFTPDEYDVETTMAAYASDDDDYTHFGYWTKKTEQRDGTYVHDVETFFGGAQGDALATITDIQGTATYYGAAAGVYVKRAGADDSLVVSDGMFTADAKLTANFGGNAIAVTNQNTVSGTISGFMDGSTDLGFADLALNKSGALAAINDVISGETDGGGTSGNWSAQFYGNAGAGTTDPLPNGRPAASDDYPMNVAGEFNGHFVNGHVAGAFGAEKD